MSIFLAIATLVTLLAWGIRSVVMTDSLSSFRHEDDSLKLEEGVVMKDFTISAYNRDQLAASMKVAQGVTLKDRSMIICTGISDGRLYTSDGDVFQFSAGAGEYGNFSKAITVKNGVHLTGDNLDLQADGFFYNHQEQTLTVTGSVAGTLQGGVIESDEVVLDLKNEEIRGSHCAWTGELAIPGSQKTSVWHFEGDDYRISKGIHTAKNATGWDSETRVKALDMRYDRGADIVTATNNVQYFGQDANLTCDKATIYRKEGRAVLEDQKRVTMLVKPEDSPPAESDLPAFEPGDEEKPVRQTENLRQYPIAIDAAKIEYWYKKGTRRAIITGQPYARQQFPDGSWRDLVAHHAEYDGEAELLKLFSMPETWGVKITNSLGDIFESMKATVSTVKGDDTLEAHPMRAVITTEEEEDTAGSTGGGSTGGTTGG